MITINLLSKTERRTERRAITVPYKLYIASAAAVLFFLHVLLLGIFTLDKIYLAGLHANWNKVAPQSKDFVAMKNEIKALEAQVVNFKPALSRLANVTELLSTLANSVPKGLWLERFSMTPDGLVIQGSVVSLSQNEMTTIGKFLQDLKTNKTFNTLWPKIELSSVQRRTIKTYDVVDFVLAGEVKK
jgi:Tfp pilus assembly protein PilN